MLATTLLTAPSSYVPGSYVRVPCGVVGHTYATVWCHTAPRLRYNSHPLARLPGNRFRIEDAPQSRCPAVPRALHVELQARMPNTHLGPTLLFHKFAAWTRFTSVLMRGREVERQVASRAGRSAPTVARSNPTGVPHLAAPTRPGSPRWRSPCDQGAVMGRRRLRAGRESSSPCLWRLRSSRGGDVREAGRPRLLRLYQQEALALRRKSPRRGANSSARPRGADRRSRGQTRRGPSARP